MNTPRLLRRLAPLSLLLAVLPALSVAPSAGASQAYPPCTTPVALPGDVRLVEPDPEIGRELAAFVGVWEGIVGEGANPSPGVATTILITPSARLAVEEVRAGRARIMLGLSEMPGSTGGIMMGAANVAPPAVLHFGTNPTVVLTMSPDLESINGRLDTPSGLRLGIVFRRCSMGETRVERPRPPVAAPATPAPTGASAAPARPPAPTPARPVVPAAPPAGPATTPDALPAPGRVLYEDDFSDPASGWTRQATDPTTRRLGYADGEYFVHRLVDRAGWNSAARTREGFTDLQVEVDARLVPPTEGGYVFLGFRRQTDGEHYAFVVDPDDQTYRLVRHVPDGPSVTIIGRTHAAAIQPGTATNRLGVRAHGADFVLLVNGAEVGRGRDDSFRQGTLTLGVGSRRSQPAEARFANLVVFSLD